MSTYTVTSKQLLDNYAVVQTLEPTEIAVGESVTIASVPKAPPWKPYRK